jgi:protein disulfide-isomerase-like protein
MAAFAAAADASSSAAAAAAAAAPEPEKNGAINLTKRNFDSSIGDGSVWLIEFYSPWCGHCKKFAATYENIAETLHGMNKGKEQKTKIKVAKVDGSKEKALALRFSITGYPAFFLVDGWNVYEFEGRRSRSKEAMVKFALKKDKKMEPISFIVSPFGPMGQLRALLHRTGTMCLDTYDYLVKSKSMPPTFAVMIMASFGVIFGTTVIIVVGLLLLPKPKID